MKIHNLNDLFIAELRDIYSAEKQITEALPKMIKACKDAKLEKAFSDHLRETEKQILRIEEVMEILSLEKKSEKCKAMAGLLEEGEKLIKDAKDDEVINAALVMAAQKVEHYEIASYGTLIELARNLGYDNAILLFKETLDEEKGADSKLTTLAQGGLNRQANDQHKQAA